MLDINRAENTGQVYNIIKGMLGTVPNANLGCVCPGCLGPVVTGYEHCFACNRLIKQGCRDLTSLVVPITIAPDNSPWYSWLQTYKGGHPERSKALPTLIHYFLDHHKERIEDLLGGDISCLSVVPSKRGKSFSEQRLTFAINMIGYMREMLKPTLRFVADSSVARHELNPSAFEPIDNIEGKRIVLIEDTWVTGATAVSAATSLLDAGASVLIVPVARKISTSFAGGNPDYHMYSSAEFSPSKWPRMPTLDD